MESFNASVSLSRFSSLILPGFIINFFILWILYLFNPDQIGVIKDYEFIITFCFAVSSLLIGLLVDSIMQWIESLFYKVNNTKIRIEVIQRFVHVLDDFDNFMYSNLKIHLYEVDANQNMKKGDLNGKKIDNHNIATFEKYMKFRISEKQAIYTELDSLLSKYYIFRNMTLPFLSIPLIALATILFYENTSHDLIANKTFIISISCALLLSGIYLIKAFGQLRKDYLFTLYQASNFYIKTLKHN